MAMLADGGVEAAHPIVREDARFAPAGDVDGVGSGALDSMTTAAPGIDPKLRMGIEVLKPEAVDWKRVGLAQSLPRMYSPYSFVMGWVGETEASDNTVNNSRVKDQQAPKTASLLHPTAAGAEACTGANPAGPVAAAAAEVAEFAASAVSAARCTTGPRAGATVGSSILADSRSAAAVAAAAAA
eukprot:CAMPEP_0183482894 /NCGR_PEP_ID=MMETSP0370-20130417/177453_1 /TAXON_ID=268820 /ORGANISM="Peridinium aciculiferum, Strain PAER-2" /LENGTH=183 /DNA_ID=CAMNT_0025676109 /DNA_START=367 /DNA_END=920 /DNA_ORIENTATION=+